VSDIELCIVKVESNEGNLDHTIKTLYEKIAEQHEGINKLNKENKHMAGAIEDLTLQQKT